MVLIIDIILSIYIKNKTTKNWSMFWICMFVTFCAYELCVIVAAGLGLTDATAELIGCVGDAAAWFVLFKKYLNRDLVNEAKDLTKPSSAESTPTDKK